MMLAGLCITAAAALSAPRATVSPATVLITTVPTQGIDVSSLQHPRNAVINWADVAGAGSTFAAIKASEGTYYVNPYYASDAVQAASAGLLVMPYAFANPFHAKVNGSAKEQADVAVRQLTSAAMPAGQMLPLALDIEPDPYAVRQKTNQCYGLRQTAMVTWIRQFLAEAQLKTGNKPVIYTTTAWWKACTGNSAVFGSYPLWIASYGKSAPGLPAGWSKYTFWQQTAKGSVPGITGSRTDEDLVGTVKHASSVAKPVSIAQFAPPTPVGFISWITAALLAVSVGIAAFAGFTIGFRRHDLRRARTDGAREGPATRWPLRLALRLVRSGLVRRAGPQAGSPPAQAAIARRNENSVLSAGQAVEVDRKVHRDGQVLMVGEKYRVGTGLAGTTITLRLDGHLMHAIADGMLAGTWPCPVTAERAARLNGARAASAPLPRAATARRIDRRPSRSQGPPGHAADAEDGRRKGYSHSCPGRR
jgi:GH25 family lysozyme M1 (1,4-beta-N-acetylmuramidase)